MNSKHVSQMKHPAQPVGVDDSGIVRFKRNAIVDFLIRDARPGFDMNTIIRKVFAGEFSREDMVQFYQLIGYSVEGFGDLSLVPDAEYEAAKREAATLMSPRFVIRFNDVVKSFNQGSGYPVALADATRYDTRDEAEAFMNEQLAGGDMEVLDEVEASG